jgi:hypothetical protein
MGRISTQTNPAYIVIDADAPADTLKGLSGVTIELRDADTGQPLPSTVSLPRGFVDFTTPSDVDRVEASTDGWVTILGPWLTIESQIAGTLAGAAALAAQGKADDAARAVADLSARLSNVSAPTWDTIGGTPPFDPKGHAHAASTVTVTPTGALTSTNVQAALQQLLGLIGSGGSGGGGSTRTYVYSNGSWVDGTGAQAPATAPAGVVKREYVGPSQPVSVPDWPGVPTLFVLATDY